MEEAVIRVVFARGKPTKWTEGKHADVALAKPPLVLKLVREKDFREK